MDNDFEIIIEKFAHEPKYSQIVYAVIFLIEKGVLKKSYQLPSITELAEKNALAKATVAKAYNILKKRGVIISRHGKGFYIAQANVKNQLNIFVLFDTFNGYKEILYNSFKNALPPNTNISIFFHSYNLQLFEQLIVNNLGSFNFYVIMPHFNEDVSAIINKIPPDQLLLIDNNVPGSDNKFAAVYQDFDNDLYNALKQLSKKLKKYKQLNIVLGKDRFQFVPDGIMRSYYRFCKDFNITHMVFNTLKGVELQAGQAFIIFSDTDMIGLIKRCKAQKLKIGRDIGLLSYDDTPLKEILINGVTVVSTDFELMGKTAGTYILDKVIKKTANPYKLYVRSTI